MGLSVLAPTLPILAAASAIQGTIHGASPASAAPSSFEWTFEQARQCWQTMVRPVQHVGVPGY